MTNKAVFLDRDGVINNPGSNYYVWKKEDFKFNNNIINSLLEYQKAAYLLIIISNQGGISKKLYSKNDVNKLHEFMTEKFFEKGIIISEIYYCPHHSDIENCICRKPDSGMLEKAMARFNISAENSFLIGDSQRDIQAAEKAGIKGILITKNAELPKLD